MSELPLFNFETMSGVFPGTRTQVYQRVRLEPVAGGSAIWAQLLWYAAPPACVVHRWDAARGQIDPAPLLRILGAPDASFGARLAEALAAAGLRLRACGGCAHWAMSASATPDGLALGECRLRRAGEERPVPLALAGQSLLALDCPAWAPAIVDATQPQPDHTLPVAPLPRIAVITESKLKPWQRWARRARRTLQPPPPPSLDDLLAERSGVGAGTEPCTACQGRIANLGALTVESDEGDKQTFSVWRCRLCATLYLSDWIDRWERVDSLETEETLYRIAPVEAAELLTLIASVRAGDHPQGRQARRPQRDWIAARLRDRAPVSHVVKQGR